MGIITIDIFDRALNSSGNVEVWWNQAQSWAKVRAPHLPPAVHPAPPCLDTVFSVLPNLVTHNPWQAVLYLGTAQTYLNEADQERLASNFHVTVPDTMPTWLKELWQRQWESFKELRTKKHKKNALL